MSRIKLPRGKQIGRHLLFFLICGLIGMGLGFLMIHKIPDDISVPLMILNVVLGLILLFLAVFLQIIWHEMGHMIAALMRGWKFLSFMIVSFMISMRNGKLHFSRLKIAGAGGQCLMMPPAKGDTDFGIAFYNAGGILMNTLTGLVSFLLLVLCWDSLCFLGAVLLYGLGLSGCIFALINAIPKISSDLANDGQNILSLRKDRFSTSVFLESLRILGGLQQGKTIEEVMPNYFCDGHEIDYKNAVHVMACSFDLSLAIARMDFEKAHRIADQIDAHRHQIVRIYQKEIAMEEIYLNLVAPVSGVSAMRYLDEEMETYLRQQVLSCRPTALRVKYTLAHIMDKNEREADRCYLQFLKACDRYHVLGEIKSEKKLVEYAKHLPTNGMDTNEI